MSEPDIGPGAWPVPSGYAHFLLPVEARLPLPSGNTFEFFGPMDPPLDDIVDVPHSDLADEPGVLARIVFGHLPLDHRELFAGSQTLSAVVDAASQRWSGNASLLEALDSLAEESAGRYEVTVAEVMVANAFEGFTNDDGTPMRIPPEACLAPALRYLRRYLYALSAATTTFLSPLPTLERLPPVLPFFERTEGREPYEPALLTVNDTPARYERLTDVDEADLGRVEQMLDLEHFGHPFAVADQILVDAGADLHFEGNFKSAVVFAAASAEVLLDGLLASLLWEERTDPRVAAETFESTGLAARVRRHYHDRLGGNWSTTTEGSATGDWQQQVASTRHRVVHSGFEPSETNAVAAMEAIRQLRRFIVDRITDTSRGNLSRYPRSALLLLGREQLQAAGHWSPQLERAEGEIEARQLVRRFGHWMFFVDGFRRQVDMTSDPEDWSACRSVSAIHSDGSMEWWINDESRRVAKRGSCPPDFTDEAREALDSLCRKAEREEWSGTSAWLGEVGDPADNDPWRPNYEVLPDLEPW